MAKRLDVVGIEGGGDETSRRNRLLRLVARSCEVMADTGKGLPRSWTLMLALAINLFVIIAVILGIVTVLGVHSVASGAHPVEYWTSVPVLVTIVAGISLILAFALFAMVNGMVLVPVRSIFKAVSELGRGNFDVRVKVGGGAHIYEIDDFAADFNRAAEELSGVEALRAEFIDDFSHEFKTPIVSIQGFADLLRSDDLDSEDRREYAQIIYDESKRLATMASDILLLRQAESKAVLTEAETEDVPVGEQVRLACALLQEKWAEKALSFDVRVEDVAARGNAAFLDRAWMNLIDNACKFSSDGGTVTVTLAQRPNVRKVRPTAGAGASARKRQLEFCVENDGAPIPPEALERVFERFYQADASHATRGCGLGLPLVKRVIELHGGSVSCASTPSGHTSFSATLPLADGRV